MFSNFSGLSGPGEFKWEFPHKLVIILLMLLVGVGLAACKHSADKSDSDQAQSRKYDFTGRVVSIDKSIHRVTVEHGPIHGYMEESMTMPYPLKEERDYDALAMGDDIRAKLVVTPDNRTWLEDIVVTAKNVKPAVIEKAAEQPAKPAHPMHDHH